MSSDPPHRPSIAPAKSPPSPPVEKLKMSMDLRHGLPHLTIPLPSRNELCVFVLRPVTHTVGDLLEMLRKEDAGIDRAVVRNDDGIRVSSTTSIQNLLTGESPSWTLTINDDVYRVDPEVLEKVRTQMSLDQIPEEELKVVGNVSGMVGQLYESLNIQEHQALQAHNLHKELEALQDQLGPLEEQRAVLAGIAERRAAYWCYGGLFAMCFQAGMLGRLTWWEYSWDIMEPVTYFVTYGNAIACFAYFVLTKQDYLLPDVRDRQYLLSFHKAAKKQGWDVDRYNYLCEEIVKAKRSLMRLKDPLKLRVPHSVKSGGSEKEEAEVLGSQMNLGQIKNMLKGKFSSS